MHILKRKERFKISDVSFHFKKLGKNSKLNTNKEEGSKRRGRNQIIGNIFKAQISSLKRFIKLKERGNTNQ